MLQVKNKKSIVSVYITEVVAVKFRAKVAREALNMSKFIEKLIIESMKDEDR